MPAPSAPATFVRAAHGGLTVKAYRGDACVLFAMNLDQAQCTNFAGFAIARSLDGGKTFTYIPNRLSFDPAKGVVAGTDPNTQLAQRETSDIAPFQKFRWIDFPPDTVATPYTYKIDAKYFASSAAAAKGGAQPLTTGASVTLTIALQGDIYPNFQIGFTRGYVSSQAFAEKYAGVTTMRESRSVTFKTLDAIPGTKPAATWRSMYKWLGGNARIVLNDFLTQCDTDKADYDVFAYDLDEPDFLKVLVRDAQAGRKIRMILDDAALHTKASAMEPAAAALLTKAGVTVKRGHFKRYAHDKCVIERDASGGAVRVLTGSANFSVRGLYVQSNSIIRINDPAVAAMYGEAFDQAWTSMPAFPKSKIAVGWFDATGAGIPTFSVSFAPHTTGEVSLDRVAAAINNAKSSVLFAVMELEGGGTVMSELLNLQQRADIFSYGVTQTTTGLKYYKGGGANGLLVPFGYLKAHVPLPFRTEWNGGMGQVIHHKFVVIDFNTDTPQVFCGSSNLAEGGEEENGDNMLAISDPAIAALYAVEAIKLVDHYEFRAIEQTATSAAPMLLQGPSQPQPWWKTSFDPANIKNRERVLFSS
jgi:phosphatidylserine/phosphatidylglycerophosphate/cardiolipin synthase-like enzyme